MVKQIVEITLRINITTLDLEILLNFNPVPLINDEKRFWVKIIIKWVKILFNHYSIWFKVEFIMNVNVRIKAFECKFWFIENLLQSRTSKNWGLINLCQSLNVVETTQLANQSYL